MQVIPQEGHADESRPMLGLHVRGLNDSERALLRGVIILSERDKRGRTPKLRIVEDGDAETADVFIIDGRDHQAAGWARSQPWLSGKAAIWIDVTAAPPGHSIARRPVQWPTLPILLAKAVADSRLNNGISHRQFTPTAASTGMERRVGRFMVVDDSGLARLQIRGHLEASGHVVKEAESVEQALELLAAHDFDAIFMDVLMPGADGYEGCRRVKARLANKHALPVIMLTSRSSPFDRIRGTMAGCDAYLTKPVDRDRVDDAIRSLLGPGLSAQRPAHAGSNAPASTALAREFVSQAFAQPAMR